MSVLNKHLDKKLASVTHDDLRELLVKVLISNYFKDECNHDYWIRIKAQQLDYITFDMHTPPNTYSITDKGRSFLERVTND